jgi:hypothetical protein
LIPIGLFFLHRICVHNLKKFDNIGEDLEDLISISTTRKEGNEITLIDILGSRIEESADDTIGIVI